jgi:putative ABC transport system permease protein
MTWRRFFRRSRLDAQVARDLEFYLETETADNIARGMTPEDARDAARRKLGNPTFVREEVYRMNTAGLLDGLRRDLALALRNLARHPAFAATAVLTLGLGIGANAAIFSVFYRVLLRPLPYPRPERLLSVGRDLRGGAAGLVATQEFIGWQAESHTLAGLAAWGDADFNLTGLPSPERVRGGRVTAGFFALFGVRPSLGRVFTPDDCHPGAADLVILSQALWQRRFQGNRSVIGETLVVNGVAHVIVGVLPADFRFPADLDIEALVPLQLPAYPDWSGRGIVLTDAAARPRAGIPAGEVLAELNAITARYRSQIPRFYYNPAQPSRITAVPLQEKLTGRSRPALVALVVSVGLLLLIASVNVANLQLARASARRREIGLRVALGASRTRIGQWLAAEIVVVTALAWIAAQAIAYGLLALLRNTDGVSVAGTNAFEPGWSLTLITTGFAACVAVITGLIPALTAPRLELSEVLKSGSNAVMGGRGVRARSGLVVIQVALALVLLIGSGVLLRSMQRVLAVELGFRPDRLLTVAMRLPEQRYATTAKQRVFAESLLERVNALPGVAEAATASSIPLRGYMGSATILLEGQPVPPQALRPGAALLVVSPAYFRTMGTPILSGRPFDAADNGQSMPVAIVNSAFARKFFPAGDAVGRRITWGNTGTFTTIIGVAADMRQLGRESAVDTEFFLPVAQNPVRYVNLLVRARIDAASLASEVRSAVWAIDRDQPIFDIATMDDVIRRHGANRVTETFLLTAFGVLAMALAGIGIYGVIAELVSQRTREIGLRMALGARSGDLLRMLLRRCLLLTAGGLAIGAGMAFYLVRYLQSLVFGVEPRDGASFGGAGLLLLAVAVVAGYLPARRAARIDPAVTLRSE